MALLFAQLGYTASVYSVESQLWLWFKGDPDRVESFVEKANRPSDAPRYAFNRGFMDLWKTSPLRRRA
jgi:hypothetical protein